MDEAVRAARHVLSLDPTNNLAAYLEGLAHECGGAHERALGGYLRALELDPWDQGALTRAKALDGWTGRSWTSTSRRPVRACRPDNRYAPTAASTSTDGTNPSRSEGRSRSVRGIFVGRAVRRAGVAGRPRQPGGRQNPVSR
ncbi:hypothetical protein GCM10018965_037250 [Nonomuraea roseola]